MNEAVSAESLERTPPPSTKNRKWQPPGGPVSTNRARIDAGAYRPRGVRSQNRRPTFGPNWRPPPRSMSPIHADRYDDDDDSF